MASLNRLGQSDAPLDWLVASALTVSENETATETGRWLNKLSKYPMVPVSLVPVES